MKPYKSYQYLKGTSMTSRDKEELGSDFWNEGKFNNYVLPHLKLAPEQSFVDMGCNAGLHLKMAEELGFGALGVDTDKKAIERGKKWRDDHGFKYQIIDSEMNEIIDDLPVVDYTVFINAHYYLMVNEFLEYLDKLRRKTRYCIIVTDEKNRLNRCWASADNETIRSYFREWEEVGFIGEKELKGKHARKLTSHCFKSPWVDKIELDKLDSSNHVQDDFCAELDEGKDYKDTKYYKIIKPYRKNWSEEKINNWFQGRVDHYFSIKGEGLRTPIIVDQKNEIVDGNHRYAAIRHLGFKQIFIEKV